LGFKESGLKVGHCILLGESQPLRLLGKRKIDGFERHDVSVKDAVRAEMDHILQLGVRCDGVKVSVSKVVQGVRQ
jgi:hypothetical protein